MVRLQGIVAEFISPGSGAMTEITSVSGLVVCSGSAYHRHPYLRYPSYPLTPGNNMIRGHVGATDPNLSVTEVFTHWGRFGEVLFVTKGNCFINTPV